MARYSSFGRLDSQYLTDGDRGFRGIDSYLEPTSLEAGLVEVAENMRLEGDLAETRKGLEFKAGNVSFTYSGTDQVFASALFSDPATNSEFIIVATKDKAILWNDSNDSGVDIAYPVGEVVNSAMNPSFVQAAEKIILFRGTGDKPLEWDGDYTTPTAFTVKENLTPGAGREECPSTTFGIYFANRLIVPQPSDSLYTLVASDILDTDNFYEADSQFRLNRGSAAGGIVGAIGYQENQLIVFQRNSIFLINNITTTSAANVYEVTNQHGCVARKSIAASGPQIYFLADSGVMTLQQGLDPAKGLGVAISKVSGESIPLSRPIQDQFTEVNFASADKAVGKVFDNKYYLALPGTASSTTNDRCVVFNILTNSWSSVDSFPAGFQIDDFVVVTHGNKRRLFAVSDKGWHLMEETDGAVDKTGTIGNATTTSTAVSARLRTRSYTLGDISVKSWKQGQLGVEVKNGDQFSIDVKTTDPDRTNTVLSYTSSADEELLLRFGSGRVRGYAAQVEVNVTSGRPKFRHVSMDGIAAGLSSRREVA